MHKLSVFTYLSPRQYLLDSLTAKRKQTKGFSIRTWSKEMGLSSQTLLTMLLEGKKPLEVKHALFLVKGLQLSPQERIYFQALLLFDSVTRTEKKNLGDLWFEDIKSGKAPKNKKMDNFVAITHWIPNPKIETHGGKFSKHAKNLDHGCLGKACLHKGLE